MIHGEGAFGYDSFTVSTTTLRLDATKRSKAVRAVLTCETADIRYRYDPIIPGENEDADAGHVLAKDGNIVVEGKTNCDNFRFIRSGGTDGILRVTYEQH